MNLSGFQSSDLFNISTDSGENLLVLGVAVDGHLPLHLATCVTHFMSYTYYVIHF